MQASIIRDKYKRILEEPEEEDSEDQLHFFPSPKKRVLTENSQLQNTPHQHSLSLRQKLAQCLSNCKQYTDQIEHLRKEQKAFKQQKMQWQQTESQLLQAIQQQKNVSRGFEARIGDLQVELRQAEQKFTEIGLQRELQQKQSQFYKKELDQLQMELEKKEKEFKACEKEFRNFQKVKKENQYLRNDVERLSKILEDSLKLGKVSSQLVKKHFLGKPHRELEMWYPQQLVGEVEHFLKKHQIGHGNREFTSGLVKFIDKIVEKSKDDYQKIHPKHSLSKNRQREQQFSLKKTNKVNMLQCSTKKNSYNLSSMRDDLLRSNVNSFWKKNEGNRPSQPSLSLVKNECWDVVNEFRSVVFELLLEKEIKRKKIKKLIDSMSSALMESFENHQNLKQFNYQEDLCNFRLTTEDVTAPLK